MYPEEKCAGLIRPTAAAVSAELDHCRGVSVRQATAGRRAGTKAQLILGLSDTIVQSFTLLFPL